MQHDPPVDQGWAFTGVRGWTSEKKKKKADGGDTEGKQLIVGGSCYCFMWNSLFKPEVTFM